MSADQVIADEIYKSGSGDDYSRGAEKQGGYGDGEGMDVGIRHWFTSESRDKSSLIVVN